MKPAHCNIKVVVRVRPRNKSELQMKQKAVLQLLNENALLFDPESDDDDFFDHAANYKKSNPTNRSCKALSLAFDRVFGANVDNVQIFEECTAPLVDKLLDGSNCSVFAYGATGSGKTFTMLGTDSCPGLTSLTIRHLFQKMEEQRDERSFKVGVSYLEVYNEQVRNLLTKSAPLQLREHLGGVCVYGLTLEHIENATDLLEILLLGNANRTQHPTDANAESSRSHAVFQVHIRITERATQVKRLVKLSMIDLAGNERAIQTRCSGERFKEGAHINRSLLALANCISKLSRGQKHIPYRDSNLTRILKDSLGGNCYTVMVANVSMSMGSYQDTYNTLRYASCATNIPHSLKENVLKYQKPKSCAQLEAELRELKAIITENTKAQAQNAGFFGEIDVRALDPWIFKLDAAYERVIAVQEHVGGLESTLRILNLRQDFSVESYGLCVGLSPVSDKTLPPAQVDYQQVQQIEEDLACNLEELLQAHKELHDVKLEANNSRNVAILTLFQKYKEALVQNRKLHLEMDHSFVVNYEYMANSRRLLETLKSSLDLNHKLHIRSALKLLYHSHDYHRLLSDVKSNHLLYKDDLTALERDVDKLLQIVMLTTMHMEYGCQDGEAHEKDANPSMDFEDAESCSTSQQDDIEVIEKLPSSSSSNISNATYIIERSEIVGDRSEVTLNECCSFDVDRQAAQDSFIG